MRPPRIGTAAPEGRGARHGTGRLWAAGRRLAPVAGLLAGAGLFAARLPVHAVAVAGTAAALLVAFGTAGWRRRPSRRAQGDPRAGRDVARRLFWQASGDFAEQGWARADLAALALLCRNLEKGRPLTRRLAERLRSTASAVLAGVIDRLEDVERTGAQLRLPGDALAAVGEAKERLVAGLAETPFREGEPVPIDPARLAAAAEAALAGVLALRTAVAPEVIAHLVPLLSSRLRRADDPSAPPPPVRADLARVSGRGRVAVAASDLAAAFDALLAEVLASRAEGSAVELRAADEERILRLEIVWTMRDRLAFSPARLLEAAHRLSFFGATVDLTEEPDDERGRLELRLPRLGEPGRAAPGRSALRLTETG